MARSRPPYSSLPLRHDGPPGNAWGLFGINDELGMLNLLSTETTLAAAKEIIAGKRISTDLPLDKMQFPCFGRPKLIHSIQRRTPRTVNDDVLDFNNQVASQWDGFRHYGFQKEERFFNNLTQNYLLNSTRNGIHVWVENGGITGRGVLLDFFAWAESHHRPLPAFATSKITMADLVAVAHHQGVSFREGDILLVRSGYLRAYNALSKIEAEALTSRPIHAAVGVESSEAMLRWIWDCGFAAVAGDAPSFEAWPCQTPEYSLHEWLLAGWGVPIGELFDLENLAASARLKVDGRSSSAACH